MSLNQASSTTDDRRAITVENLRFAYRQDQPVIHIPSFTVGLGEQVFLHGPSGSGKTTLLGLLAGILTPNEGSIRIMDQEFSGLAARVRDRFRGAHMGYIFQMFNLIPYLNVRDNIILPCRLSPERKRRLGDRGAADAAGALAAHLGIESLLNKPVTELSVGQQQRVAAARALIGAPEIIIADEPTSALDTDHRESFLKLLFEEAGRVNASVLFVSHDHTLKPLFKRSVSLTSINRMRRS